MSPETAGTLAALGPSLGGAVVVLALAAPALVLAPRPFAAALLGTAVALPLGLLLQVTGPAVGSAAALLAAVLAGGGGRGLRIGITVVLSVALAAGLKTLPAAGWNEVAAVALGLGGAATAAWLMPRIDTAAPRARRVLAGLIAAASLLLLVDALGLPLRDRVAFALAFWGFGGALASLWFLPERASR
jgi:hypothetical protein